MHLIFFTAIVSNPIWLWHTVLHVRNPKGKKWLLHLVFPQFYGLRYLFANCQKRYISLTLSIYSQRISPSSFFLKGSGLLPQYGDYAQRCQATQCNDWSRTQKGIVSHADHFLFWSCFAFFTVSPAKRIKRMKYIFTFIVFYNPPAPPNRLGFGRILPPKPGIQRQSGIQVLQRTWTAGRLPGEPPTLFYACSLSKWQFKVLKKRQLFLTFVKCSHGVSSNILTLSLIYRCMTTAWTCGVWVACSPAWSSERSLSSTVMTTTIRYVE